MLLGNRIVSSYINLTVTTTVADVARYSEFVPFCTRSKMESGSMVGTLTVSYGPIKTTWSSDVAVSDAGSVMARNRGGDVVKTLDTGHRGFLVT